MDWNAPDAPEPPGFQFAARSVLAILIVLLALWTLHNFLPALAWAGVFAIAIWPLYQRAEKAWPPGRLNLVLPSVFTAVIALLFLAPLGVVVARIARDWHDVAQMVRHAQQYGIPPPEWLQHLPVARAEAVGWWRDNLSDPQGAADLLARLNRGALVGDGRSIGRQLLHRATLFGFTLLTLFFLFRDGMHLTMQIRSVVRRAFGPSGERLAGQIVASVHGTVDGLVLVGIGEGILLGVAYAVAGTPHPALLGAVTAVAAMVPFGAPVMFALAALMLLGQGRVIEAIVVVAFGMAVTFVADHFVRPVLIGGQTQLPFLFVLLGILGGIEIWGLLGLFLGPALMAAAVMLWREWAGEA